MSEQRLDKEYVAAKFRKYGTVNSSGRQRIVHAHKNVDVIESLTLRQDNMNGHFKLNIGSVLMLCSNS